MIAILRKFLNTTAGSYFKLEKYLWQRQAMRKELSKVPIVKSGLEAIDGRETPFVLLANDVVLYGRLPTDFERQVYRRWRGHIMPAITEETIQVAMDVVLRYLYPHAMPHLTMPYPRDQRLHFHKQHIETINDLPNLSDDQKRLLVNKFEIKQGDSFMDIGAYMGYGTVRMARELGETSKIIAVEADLEALWLLQQNIKVNNLLNKVTVIHNAVSNHEGMASFYKTQRQANSLISDIVNSENIVETPTDTIDGILQRVGMKSLDRLSITINGAEVEAVEGMKNTVMQSEHMRISMAGWYKRDQIKICDIVTPILREYGLQVAVGIEGGVIAWK